MKLAERLEGAANIAIVLPYTSLKHLSKTFSSIFRMKMLWQAAKAVPGYLSQT